MHRTFSAFCAAAVLACGSTLAAQSPATTTSNDQKWEGKEITVNGCVEKTKSGGYFLMDSRESSSPATTTGTSGTTTTGSSTTTKDNDRRDHGLAWNLGQSDRFAKYVGQRIEVIGRPEHDTSGDQLKGTQTKGEIKARDIDVKSVKMLSTTCR